MYPIIALYNYIHTVSHTKMHKNLSVLKVGIIRIVYSQ